MNTAKSVIILVSCFLHFKCSISVANPNVDCLKSTTLEDAVSCFDKYTVKKDSYTQETYALAQPTSIERTAWKFVIHSLLSVDGSCDSVKLPEPLVDIYTISQFTDLSGPSYCVLSEVRTTEAGQYNKGWGLFITPSIPDDVKRDLHISAPHPAYDLNTPQQAVALFKSVGARSLLIDGRSRLALMQPSQCVESTEKATYYVTDPAHNKEEPFYDATRAIFDWQSSNGGCPSNHCAFIQLHGKGASTCPMDQMFVSAGLGTDPASLDWYATSPAKPFNLLLSSLQLAFPTWNVSSPLTSPCELTATKNVVGRFLNGVRDELVCSTPADPSVQEVEGYFVHVEQSMEARWKEAYVGWAKALKEAFEEVV
ncbi:hypothetical protein H0H93_001239 [Arthromyces matolae]|nr:hypothetical protein H0H93_001239 [Arthromyces matolae]